MSEKVAWRFCYSEGRTLFCTLGICQRKVQWWNCQHLSNVRFSLIFLFYIFYELASCFWCKNYYSPCCYTTKYCLFAVTKYFDTFVPNFFFCLLVFRAGNLSERNGRPTTGQDPSGQTEKRGGLRWIDCWPDPHISLEPHWIPRDLLRSQSQWLHFSNDCTSNSILLLVCMIFNIRL